MPTGYSKKKYAILYVIASRHTLTAKKSHCVFFSMYPNTSSMFIRAIRLTHAD